jgi:hypothetical protein
MNYILSLAISSALGLLLVNLFYSRKADILQKIILAAGIGLGLSGQIGFYSLLIEGSYSPVFVWSLHAGVLAVFVLRTIWLYRQNPKSNINSLPDNQTLIGLGVLSLLLVPLWREAHFFPFGGWDAWSCWNLKARFIYLGGENWKSMLDPVLWRSNNHYPFLLPLINAWGWSFYHEANVVVPMFNAIVFSFLTAALLFASLDRLTRNRWAFVPALVLFSVPFVNKLSISQYSDIVVAFYFLATLSSLIQAKLENNAGWAIISGLSVGLMSFAKTEGLAAGVIIAALAVPFFHRTKLFKNFAAAAFLASVPAIIFKLAFSPANAAFVNGLTSVDSPSTLFRLQAAFMFLAVELVSLKWSGLWIILLGGLILAGRNSVRQGRWIMPAAILGFLACALGYYYLNTYFEIIWWLQTTLNRILYTILPALVWWVFYSLWASPSPLGKK